MRRLDISFLQSFFFSRDLEQGTAKRKEYIYSFVIPCKVGYDVVLCTANQKLSGHGMCNINKCFC